MTLQPPPSPSPKKIDAHRVSIVEYTHLYYHEVHAVYSLQTVSQPRSAAARQMAH
jgi:hypothetical protein